MTERLPQLGPAPVIHDVKLTVRAREALVGRAIGIDSIAEPYPYEIHGFERYIEHANGNRISLVVPARVFTVRLVRPPAGLVVTGLGGGRTVRCADEPEDPTQDIRTPWWWDIGAWLPCPECGFALLPCGASFIPQWRICLAGHAVELAADGRSAKRQPDHDDETLSAMLPGRTS